MNASREPLGCLFALLRLIGLAPGRESPAEELPYQRKDYLLTRAERVFFAALQQAVGGQAHIFCKVRLADLVFIRKGTERRQSYLNRVVGKHVDFVLCDLNDIRPLLVIELDDKSHEREDRRARDAFVDAALDAAELPILHVRAASGYNPLELARSIQERIG